LVKTASNRYNKIYIYIVLLETKLGDLDDQRNETNYIHKFDSQIMKRKEKKRESGGNKEEKKFHSISQK